MTERPLDQLPLPNEVIYEEVRLPDGRRTMRQISDFCWACFVEFDRRTGHVCPPDRDTPHR